MNTSNEFSPTTFPNFTEIRPQHRNLITEVANQQVHPLSDFNFHSLLAWSTGGKTQISELNDNLVVSIPDYVTGEHSVTFCGAKNIQKTVDTLLGFNKKIVYVPENVADALSNCGGLTVQEDRDNFDYIYDIDSLVTLAGGGSNKGKRNRISKFQRAHGGDIKLSHMSVADDADGCEAEIMNVVDQWQQTKKDGPEDKVDEPEVEAIQRLLQLGYKEVLHISRLSIANFCIGFSIHELLPDGKNTLCHFQKVAPAYENADVFLTHEASRYLGSLGCTTVNWEQDLGIPGLRYLKESYHPMGYLKKYSITRQD